MYKCRSKVGLCNNKTEIFRTIKSQIVLFIKLQFSIKCNQTLRLLHISNSNIYLKLSVNPNGFVTCIISNAFVSSPICLMILDIYLLRSLHLIKSGPGLYTCQAFGPLVYPLEGFCSSRHWPDIPDNKTDIRIKKKF